MKKLRRQNVVDLKKQVRRVLKASINLVQQRWGKLDRRKHWSNAIVDAVAYARSYSRRHPVVIRVYDGTGNVIETLEYRGDFNSHAQTRHR